MKLSAGWQVVLIVGTGCASTEDTGAPVAAGSGGSNTSGTATGASNGAGGDNAFGGRGGDEGGAGGSPQDCAEPFSSCQGDIVGAWSMAKSCPPPPAESYVACPDLACTYDVPECYSSPRSDELVISSMSYEFVSDGSVSYERTGSLLSHAMLDLECASALTGEPQETACGDSLAVMLFNGGICVLANRQCSCDASSSLDGSYTGQYTVDGGGFEIVTDEGDALEYSQYCIQGSELRIRVSTTVGEMTTFLVAR